MPNKTPDNPPDPRHLKHRPVVLLGYSSHDGMYAGDTDCQYLSLGWAQWDPRTLSVKILRYIDGRWSRQSEEVPLHRVLDAALLIASTVEQSQGGDAQNVTLDAGMLERQDEPKQLAIEATNHFDRCEFEAKLHDPLVLRRLGKLADALIALREAGQI